MAGKVNLSCKAVLFDMDGRLVDSTRVVELAWGWWAERHGIPLEVVLSFSHGPPTVSTMEHFLPARDHTHEVEEMEGCEETQPEGMLAAPGAIDVVHALQNHPWAIGHLRAPEELGVEPKECLVFEIHVLALRPE
jgi:mannitol-1-/sugar-/sorbitol-6-phosphatase